MFNWSTTRRNAVENHTINGHKLQNMMKRLPGPDLAWNWPGHGGMQCSCRWNWGCERDCPRMQVDVSVYVCVLLSVCDGQSQLQN